MNQNDIILELREKYKQNTYILQKLDNYITNLPGLLKNLEDDYNKRNARKEELTKERDVFMENFLAENQYYYIPQTEIFLFYNKLHYRRISEDDIVHKILQTISSDEKGLNTWKYKIKTSMIKIIKDTPLHKSIPESETIQFVLSNLYPNTFKSKNHTKYFLTIIGDSILKKEEKDDKLIFIADPSFKEFLNYFSQQIYSCFGKNFTDMIKLKYYDHVYDQCRILDIVDPRTNHDFIKNNILDILSVCCHYSRRYESSDNFLKSHCYDITLNDTALFLKTNTAENIVAKFIQEFTTNDDKNMTYRNVYFLWREFLKKNNLPCIISQSNFKQQLQQMKIYDSDKDICLNIKSKMPSHWETFSKFWSQNIVINDNIDDVFEIDELTSLFNKWVKNSKLHINEEQFKETINWMYPDIGVENERYIYNISCKLWDKQNHIDLALNAMKTQKENSFNNLDSYKYYCKYVKKYYDGNYIVSKKYFEDYIEKL